MRLIRKAKTDLKQVLLDVHVHITDVPSLPVLLICFLGNGKYFELDAFSGGNKAV